jgi:penicillin-binding protein 2
MGAGYGDTLPLKINTPEYNESWSGDVKSSAFKSYLSSNNIDLEISASELFAVLRVKYNVPEEWSYSDARAVIGVRYGMDRASFSTVAPYTFATDITVELIAAIADRSAEFSGVRAETNYVRSYQTTYAAHILGRIGPIFSEEYAALKELGYSLTDKVGKDGAELAFESYLRGINGSVRLAVDADGRTVEMLSYTEPAAGSNVILTIDLELQKITEVALAAQIESMRAAALTDETKPQDVAGGAAVVIDVRTGEILSMASYPTFDISRFSELYNELAADPYTPIFNRALSGIYSPGSVFKMVTSVAGLESGVITPETIITCTGRYTYYKLYQPTCWIWASRVTHGDETVVRALRDSCNIFFYETGRRVGISTLSKYALDFGLGGYTGIELKGEAKGSVASPESKQKIAKQAWVDGDTLQAAIGQSYNMFTPLQICNYIATLCNGGTRYNCHILKYAVSGDYSAIVSATQSIFLEKVNMSDLTYKTVMEGMLEVTENGTASAVFKNYEVHVGGKTGSVQVSDGTANSVFCAFAPYDNPEIAVVVIVEHGGSGNSIAPVALNISKRISQIRLMFQVPRETLCC